MKRGCIAVNITKCDVCKSNIEHGERYLLTDAADGKKEQRICASCCVKKKYAKYITEKGEKILSFLAEDSEAARKK
jgi:hypothetical protein